MSWGLEWLGLEPDADERTIKRAYAKRLRVTRPDEDAAGFQELHEAYQAALAWVQARAEHASSSDDAIEAVETVTAEAVVPHDPVRPAIRQTEVIDPAVDASAFAQRVVAAASDAAPAELEHWLQQQPELWSLRDKPQIGAEVLHQLLHTDAAIHARNFNQLSAFFSWNVLDGGVDPDVASACRWRLHRRWLLQAKDPTDLTTLLSHEGPAVTPTEARARVERLTQPRSRLRCLFDALPPGRVDAMRRTLEMLDVRDAAQTPSPMQPAQVGFWLAVAHRNQINAPKLQLALLRSLLCALGWLALLGAIGLVDDPTRRRSGGVASINEVALFGSAAILLFGSLLLPVIAFIQWQVGAEHPRPRSWIARLLFIPVLAIGALLIIHMADARMLGSVLAWGTMALAGIRLWVRGQFAVSFSPWMIFVAIPVVKLGAAALMVGEVAVAIALLLWVVDAVNQVPLANAPGHARKRG
ncbi:heat-shock protein [Stenotrophomonas sp. PS02289]|uniref:heat-shock protein n=1 Tax=Stenotrophomonas sp. PS02289 TaxID=2991422 RepID=UPI00249CEC73|nr:heat-shock protein [Stenotrophomonas sp. PS02289]